MFFTLVHISVLCCRQGPLSHYMGRQGIVNSSKLPQYGIIRKDYYIVVEYVINVRKSVLYNNDRVGEVIMHHQARVETSKEL